MFVGPPSASSVTVRSQPPLTGGGPCTALLGFRRSSTTTFARVAAPKGQSPHSSDRRLGRRIRLAQRPEVRLQ
jgi:hypothetical protein